MGFNACQAQFLTLVGLHSGYCLRRQYASFAGLAYGKNVRDFLDGLVEREFARRFTYRGDSGHIYHLNARRLYRAIGQEDNRNRRHAGPALVARKLMLLDYVLLGPDRDWYATEEDKFDLFVRRFGIDVEALPRRIYLGRRRQTSDGMTTIRYCVQKLPVFVDARSQVNFICLVTQANASEIDTFVSEHRTLLAQLPAWVLVVTGPNKIASDAHCAERFARARTGRPVSSTLTKAELTWLFETRRTIEAGGVNSLSVTDIQRYRRARASWNDRLQRAYSRWSANGSNMIPDVSAEHPLTNGRLVVCWLPYAYRQLGSLPGVT